MAEEILDAMPTHPDIGALRQELAETEDENIDLDSYSDDLAEFAILPDYCYLVWRDNELTVLPNVEIAAEDNTCGEDLPETATETGYFCHINDHGNVTLYGWNNGDWREVWAVV